MEDRTLSRLKEAVTAALSDERVKIILFGSRARRDNLPFSDVDIGIIPLEEIEESKITLLREKIENLNIPYKVEIVNFSYVSKTFKEEALKNAIVWKD